MHLKLFVAAIDKAIYVKYILSTCRKGIHWSMKPEIDLMMKKLHSKLFQNRVLRIILGPKNEDVIRSRRKWHMRSFIFCNIIREIESRKLNRAGHVAHIGTIRNG
jgi:hypothetical protein